MRTAGTALGVAVAVTEPTSEVPAELQPLVPADTTSGVAAPGTTIKRIKYPHPETGEQVTGYRRVANAIMYRGAKGIRFYSPPLDSDPKVQADYEASFQAMVRAEKLVLVSRSERRDMWKAEKKRKREQRKEASAGS